MTPRKKRRYLRNLRVDEISAVDRGANDGAKIVLWKRDDDIAPRRRSSPDFAAIFGAKPASRDADEKAYPDHRASRVADLIVEATDGKVDRAQALRFLLHSSSGAALLTRMSKQQEVSTMPNRAQQLNAIAKQYGMVQLAKYIIDEGPSGITEQEFTKLITDLAPRNPGERADTAFARAFTAATEDGAMLRKAHAVIKNFPAMMSVAPTQVGGADATDVNGAEPDAYKQLLKLAEEQRRQSPTLTIEQAFARVYAAPENAALAGRERVQNRPRTDTSYSGR